MLLWRDGNMTLSSLTTVLGNVPSVLRTIIFALWRTLSQKFTIPIKCWFCNTNQWVPYSKRNSFNCKKCDQYNGFDKNGDYNKYMAEQRIGTLNAKFHCIRTQKPSNSVNGLCDSCNHNQEIIIGMLAKFEAFDDDEYSNEYNNYKDRLDEKYPLCLKCQEYTTQRLQLVDNQYLPKPKRTYAPSMFSLGRSSTSTAVSKSSKAPSIFSDRQSLFSEPLRSSSLLAETHMKTSSRDSETQRTPSVTSVRRKPKASSACSVASFHTTRTKFSILKEEEPLPSKPKHDHSNRRRKLFFASGWVTVTCNVAVLLLATLLFLAHFDSSQIRTDAQLLTIEKYLSMRVVQYLHICADYGFFIGMIALWIFHNGYNRSKTRVTFFDVLSYIAWPVFSVFCIFDGERNPDFTVIKTIFSAFLFFLSSMIVFFPKKLKPRKRPDKGLRSAFSVASTPASQCSSRQTSRLNNLSFNLSNLPEECPDPVESWVQQSEEPHVIDTRSKLHGLKL